MTSLKGLMDYSKLRLSMNDMRHNRSSSHLEEVQEEQRNSLAGADYKENILVSIQEMIEQLEVTSDLIKDQATEHINDNDVILTANHSDQLVEFFTSAAQSKSFHVMIAESAPSLR